MFLSAIDILRKPKKISTDTEDVNSIIDGLDIIGTCRILYALVKNIC